MVRYFAVFSIAICIPAAGGEAPPEAEVMTLFRTRCGECHGPEKMKGQLDLTLPEGVARGGKKGPAVRPGKLDESVLWARIDRNEMPPKAPLSDDARALVRKWIESGAPGLPEASKLPPPKPPGADHWAFRIPARPEVPEVRIHDRALTEIDRFIEAALEEAGLVLGPEADRATLIRRVSFDLTGLPPTPAEIALYLADEAPGAYERMVDRYLSSPRHGERWGKYWLDAAGFAESNGYFSADSERPHAWRYRDYVIHAMNEDKPLDRFVEEQIAGDELAGYSSEGDVGPETAELLTATHYLRNAQDGTGESDGNDLEQLADKMAVLDGTVQIVGTSLLGLTFQCARCHDHKFDPLKQEEYYGLEAVFSTGYSIGKWRKPHERLVMVGSRAEREEYRKKKEKVEKEIETLEKSLDGFAEPLKKQLVEERLAALEDPVHAALAKARDTAEDKRSQEEKDLLKKNEKLLEVKDDDLARRFESFAKLRGEVKESIKGKKKELPAEPPQIAALFETDPAPPPSRLLRGGSLTDPGPETPPGVPAFLATAANPYRIEPPAGGKGSGRRLALARWIASPENPLFARVMVNRVWMHHFGVGLAATPENLGHSGAAPSNPKLLDWLATELVRGGFRLKPLHRLILRSAAYRQSSAARPEGLKSDPEDRLLWRFRTLRLDAEALRDAMLRVTGELDLRAGGPSTPTHRADDGQVLVDEKAEGALRRSVYLQARRTQPVTVLEVFDAPLIVGSCTRRTLSTTPLQSLALLNSEFVLARARAFAARLEREAGAGSPEKSAAGQDTDPKLSLAFLLALGRGARPEERAICEKFLETQEAENAKEKDVDRTEARRRAWVDICQMILAWNAFLYLD